MSEWFNDDQVEHMESLAKIPREQRCPSGWRFEKHPFYPTAIAAARSALREALAGRAVLGGVHEGDG